MRVDPGPLTAGALVQTWHLDLSSALAIVLVAGAYAWCYRRGRDGERAATRVQASCFGVGIVLWAVATVGAIGAYAYILFWVRALQVLLLLYLVPFFLAQGKPLTVLCNALGEEGRDRFDRLLRPRWLECSRTR